MHKLALTVFLVTAFPPLAAMAAADANAKSERELRNECSGEITGVRECLQKNAEESEV